MSLKQGIDDVIEEFLCNGCSPSQIARLFLDEEFQITGEDGGLHSLVEVVRRRRMKIGGVNITTRKMGRPDPARSAKAKRSARMHASTRKAAARKFARSSQGKNMRRVVSRVRANRRGPTAPRRHGPPRRGPRRRF